MKVAIFGAGQLGKYLKKLSFGNHEVDLYSHSDFDICSIDPSSPVINDHDLFINCAAYTNVDEAETHSLEAYSVNVLAVMSLATILAASKKPFIHVSSEVIYGSNDPRYVPLKEDDPKEPRNIYSKSKYQSDNFLQGISSVMPRYLVLRPGWLFGPDGDSNFMRKISKKMKETEQPLNVVTDEIGSLTSVDLMWKAMNAFIDEKLPSGVYNIANEGYASRWEIAKFIHDHVLPDSPVPLQSKDYKRPVEIAKNSCLDCTKLKTALPDLEIPTWEEDVTRLMF